MPQSRQLAAIMFTDIVGYTALMGNDEQKAFELLKKNREIQKPIVEQYNGRWIKELGDGVMSSFSTASDAVNAAVKIQEACNAANKFQLKRYSIREKRYSQNYAFENNPKRLYRTMRGNNIEVDKIPTKETLERFWKPIFENEAKYNKNNSWLEEYVETINIEKPSPQCIAISDLRFALISFGNWKSPGIDNIQNYWWSSFDILHY